MLFFEKNYPSSFFLIQTFKHLTKICVSNRMNIREFIQKHRIQIVFTLTGAIGGFLYWRFVGCTSGTCAIKSVWYWSTLWGAAVGYLAGDFIHDILAKRKNKGKEKES